MPVRPGDRGTRRGGGHRPRPGETRPGRRALGERAGERLGQPGPARLQGTHLGQQAVGGGALPGVLGQAVLDQRPHGGRHQVQAGRAVHDAVQEGGRSPGTERSLARRREREHRTQVEDVARRPDVGAHGLLGRHEPGRPDYQARLRQHGGFGRAGDAEVDDPRPVLGQQHVRRLEVPVHHAHGVDRVEALRQPGGQRQQRWFRQRPVRVHRLGQRGAGHVRRGHPRHRAVHVRVHHLGGEHAADPPRRRDLTAEPGPELRVRGQLGPDGLHRHRPPAGRDAEEHPPHAALAKLSYQPVRPNRLRIVRLQFPGQRENPHHISRGRTVLPTEPTEPP